mmetsp:Transcript_23338/g.43200  ORF Transcript_23338/g.43200 Transcript_23338/m.43200 type:complete len:396 (-) Transcript_23338:50-1237(-)
MTMTITAAAPSHRPSLLIKTSDHPLFEEVPSSPSSCDGASCEVDDYSAGWNDEEAAAAAAGTVDRESPDKPPLLSTLAFPINLPSSSIRIDSDSEEQKQTKNANDDLRSQLVKLKLELAQSKSVCDEFRSQTNAARSENTALRTMLVQAKARREKNIATSRKLAEEAKELRRKNTTGGGIVERATRPLRQRCSLDLDERQLRFDLLDFDSDEEEEEEDAEEMQPCNVLAVQAEDAAEDKEKCDPPPRHITTHEQDFRNAALLEENEVLRVDAARIQSEINDLRVRAANIAISMKPHHESDCSSASSDTHAPPSSKARSSGLLHSKQASSRWNLLKGATASSGGESRASSSSNYVPKRPESLLWGSTEDLEALGRLAGLGTTAGSMQRKMNPAAAV